MEISRVAGKISVKIEGKDIHIEGAQTKHKETGEIYDIFRVNDFGVVINRTKIINHYQLPDLIILSLEESHPILTHFGETRDFRGRAYQFFDDKKFLYYAVIIVSFDDILLDMLLPHWRRDAVRLKGEVVETISHEARHIIQERDKLIKSWWLWDKIDLIERKVARISRLLSIPLGLIGNLSPKEKDASRFSGEARKEPQWSEFVKVVKVDEIDSVL